MDKEIEAIAAISKALSDLEPDAQRRVLSWASAKYNVAIQEPSGAGENSPDAQQHNRKTNGSDRSGDGGRAFDNVADLFVAADPTTQAEQLLVSGYWLQVIGGASDFTSFEANKELKDLGHQIGSINKVFDALKDQTPQLVVQTSKSGTSKQGRKRHKLTRAGIKQVEEMLSR